MGEEENSVYGIRPATDGATAAPTPNLRSEATFSHIYILDFSARSAPSPKKPAPDALWLGHAAVGARDPASARYFRTRRLVADDLGPRLERALDAGERVLLGVDFSLGYPAGFADAAGLPGDGPHWRRTWDYLAGAITDGDDNANNRFAVAAGLNQRLANSGTQRRFWACPPGAAGPHLTTRRPHVNDEAAPPARRRVVEQRIKSAQEAWKLFTTGSVGSQTLLGIAWLARLLARPGLAQRHGVWPCTDGFAVPGGLLGGAGLTVAEVYPRLSDDAAAGAEGAGARPSEALPHPIRDAAQVRTLAGMLATRAADGRLAGWFAEPAGLSAADRDRCVAEEGWILGDRLA